VETEMLSQWQEYRDLFPVIPTQSRFNRRRRGLIQAFNLIRQDVLQCLDIAQDSPCVIDSLPLPVVQFHLVPSSPASSNWKANGPTFGKVPSKKQTIFRYKLHLLIAMNGVILDFELASANEVRQKPLSYGRRTVLNSKRYLFAISKNNCIVPHNDFSTLFGK
jgi:hypothetical protein